MPRARSSRLTPCMLSNRVAIALILLCWPAGAQTTCPRRASAFSGRRAGPAAPAYVGSETCQPCHEDIYNAFQKSPHKLVDTQKRRGWATKACESCHGPGGKHADRPKSGHRQPRPLAPAEADRDCLKCHLNQPTHIGRIQSSHAKNEVACTACHSIHRNGPNGLVPRKMAAVNELCASCHTAVWAEFQRPYKHRLPEGAMSCVDCHNPHGSIFPPPRSPTPPTNRVLPLPRQPARPVHLRARARAPGRLRRLP
jgi:predicted CXXCH cytochrome family protein